MVTTIIVTSGRLSKYKEIMTDANIYYESYLKARKAGSWKSETMKCDLNFLSVIARKQKEMQEQIYVQGESREFIINERGRKRQVTSTDIGSRILRHSLCDKILMPELSKKIIYNSGASIKGRGTDFQRKRLERDLHKFYRDNGNRNDGYILITDFSKYYDNILHKKLYEDITEELNNDEFINWLLYNIIKSFRVDVSSLSHVEKEFYETNTINLLEYRLKGYEKKGKQYLNKSLNIGDQTSQISGNYYAHRIDNYIKIVRGHKFAGRFCDDLYIIHNSKEFLKETFKEVIKIANEYGIKINRDKTKIVKLSNYFEFLKVKYKLTKTGKVLKKIDNKKIIKERRKLKKLNIKLENGEIEYKEIENHFRTWFGMHKKYMNRGQRKGMLKFFNNLFIKEWRYVGYVS